MSATIEDVRFIMRQVLPKDLLLEVSNFYDTYKSIHKKNFNDTLYFIRGDVFTCNGDFCGETFPETDYEPISVEYYEGHYCLGCVDIGNEEFFKCFECEEYNEFCMLKLDENGFIPDNEEDHLCQNCR